MTVTSDLTTTTPSRAAAAPAFAVGAVCTLVLMAAVAAVGSATGRLGTEQLQALGLGTALALLAVGLGTVCHGKLAHTSPLEADPRLAAQRLQALLGAAFLAKLAVLAAAFGVLALIGAKFDFLVAFALAFAGAALVLQLVTAMRMARALALRARATPVQGR